MARHDTAGAQRRNSIFPATDTCVTHVIKSPLSSKAGEEDLGARGLLRRGYSAGPVSQTCFT
jgi:hypothetical protein